MKRKLRTWVKVAAAAVWLTGLSIAASCTSGNIPAAASHPGPDTAEKTALKDLPDKHVPYGADAAVTSHAQTETAAGELLFLPKLLREVASI